METQKNTLAAKKMVYLAAGGNPVGRGEGRGVHLWAILVILSLAMYPTNGLPNPEGQMGQEKECLKETQREPTGGQDKISRLIRLQAIVEIVSNHTSDALELLAQQHSQMRAFVYQNRIALDYLLAEEGGVCGKFNESECCIEINDYGETIKGLAAEIKKGEGEIPGDHPWGF
ncbi:hypothetical protein DUI87_01413 [Hirundo rustica rustica]|uniref:Uncharacterized protein n=1 Tax=Hirundo rustica rustica TaxID=333673 RepID=A0A3M0L4K7_HIRRU|nr:hypothetical protein DUI87_01413 [Hirundo rustica rustica]